MERKQNGVRCCGSVVPVAVGISGKFPNIQSSEYKTLHPLFANGLHLQTTTTHRDKDSSATRHATVYTHKKPRPGSVSLGKSGKFDIHIVTLNELACMKLHLCKSFTIIIRCTYVLFTVDAVTDCILFSTREPVAVQNCNHAIPINGNPPNANGNAMMMMMMPP